MGEGLHLSPSHREEITALLRKHLPNVEVWAYGSRVNGQSHEGSDLDLVLRGPDLVEIDTSRRADFIEALQDSTIPFLVEARDWVRLPESFHREIEREHVVLKDAVETKAHAQSEWRRAALNDVIDLRLSSVDKKSKANEHGVQLCNYTDVYNNSFIHVGMEFMTATATEREIAKCSLVAGDVVITKDSEKHDDIGVPALVREDIRDLVCGYHLAILRPRLSEVDGAYLFYALSADDVQRQFHSYANGVTRFGLRKADIGLVEITLPPLRQQRAIAHILGTLDDKIELNRRMNETLEAMARALFKSWFVDFDPVRTKMAGRDTGLSPHIADLFPDRLVDSELGEIPEGWEVTPLSECIEVVRGLSYKGSHLSSDGVPMHNLNSIYEGGGYKHEGLKGYDGEHKSQHIARAGDLIVANTEQGHDRLLIGYAAIVPTYFVDETLFSHHIYRVRPKDCMVLTSNYLCQLLNLRSMHEIVSGFANGTTVNMLPLDALQIPQLVVPARRVLAAFNDLAEAARRRQEEMSDESRTLAALRDALLPNLTSGELRVRGATRFNGRTTSVC